MKRRLSGLAAFRALEAAGSKLEGAPPREGPLVLPIRVESEANGSYGCWEAKRARVEKQRATVTNAWHFASWPQGRKPREVTLVRVLGPRGRKFDGDNLQRACKAVRDEIAALCSFDDSDEAVEWIYRQEHGLDYAVRIEIKW